MLTTMKTIIWGVMTNHKLNGQLSSVQNDADCPTTNANFNSTWVILQSVLLQLSFKLKRLFKTKMQYRKANI